MNVSTLLSIFLPSGQENFFIKNVACPHYGTWVYIQSNFSGRYVKTCLSFKVKTLSLIFLGESGNHDDLWPPDQ